MLANQLRILRVFGLSRAEVAEVLRTAQAEGCPGLRLLEKDGEFAVCVQASAPTQAMADAYCEKWLQDLAGRFDAAFYGIGEISLAQAALDALLKKRRMLVAADAQTGRIVGALLQPLDHSEAVFDFGTQSYADPEISRRIVTPPALLKKFPGDVLQAAAGRAGAALAASGADYAAIYMPATVGQAPFVLLCDKRGAVACAVSPEFSERAIANTILDLARRRALGLKLNSAAVSFRPGKDTPLLLVSQNGQLPKGGRPVLRRRPARTEAAEAAARAAAARAYAAARAGGKPSGAGPELELPTTGEFEPVRGVDDMEEDTTEFAVVPHTGEIPLPLSEEKPEQQPSHQPAPEPSASPEDTEEAARRAAAATAVAQAARRAAEASWREEEPQQLPEPARAVPTGAVTFDPPEKAKPAPGPQPAPGKREPKEKAPPEQPDLSNMPDLQEPSAGERAPGHSLLDDDIPELAVPPAAPLRSKKELQAAAQTLFGGGAGPDGLADEPDAVLDPARNQSLARIRKAERRQRWAMAAALLLVAAAIIAGAALLFFYFRQSLGQKPAWRSYGTAGFDTSAENYLGAAFEKQEGVAGYLAFSGAEGSLVYTAPQTGEDTPFGSDTAQDAPVLEGEFYLAGDTPANTVIHCGGQALAGLDEEETLKENCGFTLYTADAAYRFKTFAVYYQSETQAEADGFDGLAFGDLSSYYRYLSFVVECRARSLYDTGVSVGGGAKFLTLYSDSSRDGMRICVVGRLIEENESAILDASAVTAAETPLLPAALSEGGAPDEAALLRQALSWYTGQTAAAPADTAKSTSAEPSADEAVDELSQQVAELQSQTQALLTQADELLRGLTDVAGREGAAEADTDRGAEGELPSASILVEELSASATPTPTPTEAPSEAPAEAAAAETAAPAPTETPTEAPAEAPAAAAETISVTMNGAAQDMDLVTCLAMVAQNELGDGAPAEAYKAQCVATHCWLLSQGGYPSVYGQTPGQAALAAAQEVAHVLVTYNGSVCFTPYFASASTGTAAARDVWGNDVAWLQAVESPYDQSTASNWNTNGVSSGTARFSRGALQTAVSEKLGIDLSGVDPANWFTILSANEYGWVAQMQIGPDEGPNTTCSGRWFRENLTAGCSVDGRSLRSQCFTFTYDAALDCFIFDVYGYGHGCGLSQWGAVGYAQNGWSYSDILSHYFPGTTLTSY